MLVNRIVFYITTFVLMISLCIIMKNIIAAGIICFVVVIAGYIAISYFRGRKRLSLLEDECNPAAFMQATEKQRLITGKSPKMNAYFDIDNAAAYLVMGEFEKAEEILTSIDISHLSSKNGTLFAYVVNMIYCLYELGETTEAEKLFETQIPKLAPVNKRMMQSMDLLVAERFFFLNRFDESKEKFEELLKGKLSKRKRIEVLYRVAQIEENTGDIKSAVEKYKYAAAYSGNGMRAVKQSVQRIKELS